MTNRSLAAPAIAAVALALAGCGTAAAPGIEAAPSAGRTSAPATPATPTPTTPTTTPTTTTPKPTVPLPAAFNTKPTVSIPSGPPPKTLVIKDLIKGTGPAATPASTVTVQYVGDLYKSHSQFDASWNDGGQPVSFPLSGVIKGWTQGIPGMKEGGRRELIIPPSLAYGKVARPGSGAGHASIPPNSTLVFVIDLHAVS